MESPFCFIVYGDFFNVNVSRSCLKLRWVSWVCPYYCFVLWYGFIKTSPRRYRNLPSTMSVQKWDKPSRGVPYHYDYEISKYKAL